MGSSGGGVAIAKGVTMVCIWYIEWHLAAFRNDSLITLNLLKSLSILCTTTNNIENNNDTKGFDEIIRDEK